MVIIQAPVQPVEKTCEFFKIFKKNAIHKNEIRSPVLHWRREEFMTYCWAAAVVNSPRDKPIPSTERSAYTPRFVWNVLSLQTTKCKGNTKCLGIWMSFQSFYDFCPTNFVGFFLGVIYFDSVHVSNIKSSVILILNRIQPPLPRLKKSQNITFSLQSLWLRIKDTAAHTVAHTYRSIKSDWTLAINW